MEKNLIEDIFGVPVFIGEPVDKRYIDNILQDVDLKSFTKNNLSVQESRAHTWDCDVNTGIDVDLLSITEEGEWAHEFMHAISYEIRTYLRRVAPLHIDLIPIPYLWANYYEEGQWQERHHHIGGFGEYEGIVSFNYIHKNIDEGGKFTFHHPSPFLNTQGFRFVPESKTILPSQGTLIVFPSWLEHSVTMSKSDSPRISLSGNIRFKEESK